MEERGAGGGGMGRAGWREGERGGAGRRGGSVPCGDCAAGMQEEGRRAQD